MKTLKKTSFFLFLLITLSSFTDTSSSYTGKWKGEDKGDIGFLTLSEDSYATFEFNNQTMGGKSYVHNNVKASMTYVVDKNVTPNSIDFIITDLTAKKELGRLKGIIKKITDNKIMLAIGFGGKARPTDFSEDAIYFNRMK